MKSDILFGLDCRYRDNWLDYEGVKDMKKYEVRLKNKIINKSVIVRAYEFKVNSFASKIFFKDEEGKNVAIFNMFGVEYVRAIKETEIVK